ncbi:sirohydrochlorin chelatase [Streptosporangiaceae bacterium NEAU-GS5]|nr:sirohydrochlorin chelatase [Streptosporangiaceae bacterium NEAU-GS5]
MSALVLAAHGARSAEWEQVLCTLTARVRRMRPGRRVELGFLELSSPPLAGVLASIPGPAVIVPLLLAGGYHVHIDLPSIVGRARTGSDAVVARPLGPHARLTSILARRLAAAGLRTGDAVILGAAGSSDPAALDDVRAQARLLSVRLSRPVTAAFASCGTPSIAEALARARSGPAPRIVVASYLLAHGHFHDRLLTSGADLVTAPLGVDDDLAALVWARHDEALPGAYTADRRSSVTISLAASSRVGPTSGPTNIS